MSNLQSKNQRLMFKRLSKELDIPEKEVSDFFFDMGLVFIIALRKGKGFEELAKKVSDNPIFNRLAQRVEYFYDLGQ